LRDYLKTLGVVLLGLGVIVTFMLVVCVIPSLLFGDWGLIAPIASVPVLIALLLHVQGYRV
jgi:hypothetical protein